MQAAGLLAAVGRMRMATSADQAGDGVLTIAVRQRLAAGNDNAGEGALADVLVAQRMNVQAEVCDGAGLMVASAVILPAGILIAANEVSRSLPRVRALLNEDRVRALTGSSYRVRSVGGK